MTARVIEHQSTLSAVSLAAIVIVIYSLWGASVMNAQRDAAYSGQTTQTQLARN